MSQTLIIASRRRAGILHLTVESLTRQTLGARDVLLSVVDEEDVLPETRTIPQVRVITGPGGLTRQRNTALRALAPDVSLVTFIDDDVVLHPDYLRSTLALFSSRPDVVAASGRLVLDGARTDREVTRVEAHQALARVVVLDGDRVRPRRGVRGCAFSVRSEVAVREGFDPRLREYAWLEDLDFGIRCARHGLVVTDRQSVGVHLAVGSGRVSGTFLGMSQVINPFYLARKGVITRRELTVFWAIAFAGNVRHLLLPHRRPDRRGRLRGNTVGFWAVVRRQGVPETMSRCRAWGS